MNKEIFDVIINDKEWKQTVLALIAHTGNLTEASKSLHLSKYKFVRNLEVLQGILLHEANQSSADDAKFFKQFAKKIENNRKGIS